MANRFAHLHRNVGIFATLQTVVVPLLFVVIAGAMALEGRYLPAGGLVLGGMVPTLVRSALVQNPGATSRGLRWAGRTLIVGAIAGGLFRERITGAMGPSAEDAFVAALSFVAVAYTTTFFWLWSDPEIVVVDAR